MKRRVEETGKQDSIGSGIYSGPPRHRGGGETSSSTLSTHSNARILSSLSGNSVVSSFSQAPLKPADIMPGSVQYPVPPYSSSIPVAGTSSGVKVHGCLNAVPSSSNPVMVSSTISSAGQQHQFQRLKVEDALSYLDQVKFKFGNQPQVYNDFLDIMKEFKSQSIDTPGVIQRVSNLFKGHPELIVGFNTFLPPGYKIEVQSNDQGYAFQVSVSVPSPTSGTSTPSGTVSHHLSIPTCLASPVAPATPTPVTNTQPGPNVTPLAALTAPGNKTPIHGLHSPTTVSGYHPIGVTSVPHHAPSTSPQPSVGFTSPVANNNHSHVLAQQVVNQALSQADNHASQGQQPVEFNHAINYVNKIKNRFQGQPDKYKRFLEILHTYQKEQRNVKDGHLPAGKHLTEAEVYAQVAKLFEHQEDLLAEFGQFLPDATNHHSALSHKISCNDHSPTSKKTSCVKPGYNNLCGNREMSVSNVEHRSSVGSTKFGHTSSQMKRTPSFSNISSVGPPAKKHKVVTLRDVTLSEAGKYCNLSDYAFFDKVKRALKTQETYENFIRCLVLYNQEIVSKVELVQLVNPFLARFPEMFRWFKEFIGHNEEVSAAQASAKAPSPSQGPSYAEPSSSSTVHQERPAGELATEIDYTSCKRLGASYCALPKNYVQPKCSGRTALCKEILNDTWVSFPTWSEDSTFVTSRKTQYEEYIYRCEDERFELDVIIETNASTIRVLEGVHKKMSRMSTEEVAKYRLDDSLGGNSPTIHQRAIRRIYGDKAVDIIDGLKKNPSVAVPVVLRRLKAKEEEWREAQKGFNKVWREQNEKYYLKSLDHQGINFKQNDLKALRSKSLYNDIETLYDERHEQAEEASADIVAGPHLILPYKDKSLLDDAANLLIHHVKRQTGIHKEDKQRAKQLIRRVIPDMFFHPRQELSEDERDEEDEKHTDGTDDNSNLGKINKTDLTKEQEAYLGFDSKKSDGDVKLPPYAMATHPDEAYTLFYANNNWYLFLRLHQILCERLTRMYECARMLTLEEKKYQQDRKESTAVALRLKPKSEIEVEDYYPAFLDMVKNVLDGNMDSSTYEDSLREMFGIHAYIAFTLDKVVSYAVRQLHHLVTDSNCQSCVDLMYQEQKRGGAGGPCQAALQRRTAESTYRRRAEQMLAEENCFKIFLYKHDCKMTIELLESENEADANTGNEKWPSMVEHFSDNNTSATVAPSENRDSAEDADELESDIGSLFQHKPVFLPRNVRIWKQRSGQETKNSWRVDKDFLEIKQNKNCNMKSKSSSSDDENSHHGNKAEENVAHLKTCQFNLNHYHMVFVIDKESYLYKRLALRRARQSHHTISSRLSIKFHSWHKNWVMDNVEDNQQTACMDWLLGHGEGRMRVIANDDLDRAPYHPYNLYRAIRINIANK